MNTYHHELDVFERQLLLKELQENNFNRSKTAEGLGWDRKTLYNKVKKLNINLQAEKEKFNEMKKFPLYA